MWRILILAGEGSRGGAKRYYEARPGRTAMRPGSQVSGVDFARLNPGIWLHLPCDLPSTSGYSINPCYLGRVDWSGKSLVD